MKNSETKEVKEMQNQTEQTEQIDQESKSPNEVVEVDDEVKYWADKFGDEDFEPIHKGRKKKIGWD